MLDFGFWAEETVRRGQEREEGRPSTNKARFLEDNSSTTWRTLMDWFTFVPGQPEAVSDKEANSNLSTLPTSPLCKSGRS